MQIYTGFIVTCFGPTHAAFLFACYFLLADVTAAWFVLVRQQQLWCVADDFLCNCSLYSFVWLSQFVERAAVVQQCISWIEVFVVNFCQCLPGLVFMLCVSTVVEPGRALSLERFSFICILAVFRVPVLQIVA